MIKLYFYLIGIGCLVISLIVYLLISNKVIKHLDKKGLLRKSEK